MKKILIFVFVFLTLPSAYLFSQLRCNELCYWRLTGNHLPSSFLGTTNSTDFYIKTSNIYRMEVTSDGKVRIFNSTGRLRPTGQDTDAILSVAGKIATQNFTIIRPNDGTGIHDEWQWPDYVFKDEYNLMPLDVLEMYIKAEKRLPGIQTEKEVNEKGINVYETQTKLLQKVEELTLYLIKIDEDMQIIKDNLSKEE